MASFQKEDLWWEDTHLILQSRDVVVDSELQEVKSQVVDFVGTTKGSDDEDITQHPSASSEIYHADYDLKNFLKRPVRIQTYSIPQGEAVTTIRNINPWYDFLNSSIIKKKLDNYAYIRGNLHIEVVINATPFIYGRYMLSYLPLVSMNAHQDVVSNTDFNTDQKVRVPLSQRQNIVIDSHTNKGGSMILPFFYHAHYLPLKTAAEVTLFGKLSLIPLVEFRTASSSATNNVSVQVYAWMEDVELAGQTLALSLQSDEYNTGPISRPASIIAGIGRRLSDVPHVGKIAGHVGKVASGVAQFASLFGFTNTPVIDNSHPVKPTVFHGMASAQVAGPIEKLSLDPKCELTVNPIDLGLSDVDELSIPYLVQKESFLRAISWNISDAADTLLATVNMTPTICQTGSSGVGSWLCDTPMGNVARLFSNWRGDIDVIVRIVASQYHQGRLRVSFDPYGNVAATDSATVLHTKIIDIQESNEFTFRVPWMQPQNFLLVRSTATSDLGDRSDVAYDADTCNGKLSINVLNPLTAPLSTSDIKILIYVKGCATTEFANPSEVRFNASVLRPQSEEVLVLGETSSRAPTLYANNFGEQIASVRTLMRRTTKYMTVNDTPTLTPVNPSIIETRRYWYIYPQEYGYNPGDSTLGTRSYAAGNINLDSSFGAHPSGYFGSVSAITPYTWMSCCYGGQRGSFMYKVNPSGSNMVSLSAARWNFKITGSWLGSSTRDLTVANASGASTNPVFGLSGMTVTNPNTQSGIEFLVPFMNKYNFVSTNPYVRVFGMDYDDSENCMFQTVSKAYVDGGKKCYDCQELYGCIGPDYTLLKFISVPIRYTYTVYNITGA